MQTIDLRAAAAEFAEQGFVRLRGVVHPDELAVQQEATRALIDAGMPGDNPEFMARDGVFQRVQFLVDKPQTSIPMLALYAHPVIMGIVHEVLGPDFVSSAEGLVFKLPGNGAALPLHRDAQPTDCDPRHTIFNVDVYLDDATLENGCLLAIPGSHRWADVSGEYGLGLEHPKLVPVEADAGDALLHSSFLLHGSHTNTSAALRRTVYIEYHSAHWAEAEGFRREMPSSREHVAKRLRLLTEAVKVRAGMPFSASELPFDYQPPAGWELPPFDPHPTLGTPYL